MTYWFLIRFGIILCTLSTISWGLEVYIPRKAATFNPYFSLNSNGTFQYFIIDYRNHWHGGTFKHCPAASGGLLRI
jgi:hypothetical protein